MNLLHDDLKKLFIHYLIPAVGSALVVTIYSFIDMIAIGQGVGADGSAATAVMTPLFFIASFIGILCGVGGSVLFSIAKGEGNPEKANACFTASLGMVLVLILLVWVMLWTFRTPLMRAFGADELLLPYALQYGEIMIIAYPFFILSVYLPCFLRNDGAPNLALASVMIGAAINIFGDWYFVFPLKMGMSGAALATSLGCTAQTLIQCSHFFRPSCTLKLVRPRQISKAIKRISAIGLVSAFLEVAMVLSTMLINNQIMRYCGSTALAVFGYLLTIMALFQHIYLGVGEAAQPIISTNYGAGQSKRIHQTLFLAIRIILVMSVLFTLSGILFPKEITLIFVKETPELMAEAPHILRIYFISFAFLGINTLAILYLQSISKDLQATALTALRGLLLNIPLLLILPLFLGGDGIWWSAVISEAVTMLVAVGFIKKSLT